ncbi:MBL fold metallo-hydrolase [Aciduliprofundum sp. MAR08-339]|uniref:MBL fold metallo-hydrolase n=1 Tax=Aciduliprofundum sp. (strain MAR08-339) TaxID=673860 RepID=UPI00064F1761
MEIRWHGHSCFEIGDGTRIVIDPHDGRSIGIKTPRVQADIVLVTHHHFDHDAVRVVRGNYQVIDSPGDYEVGDLRIKGIEAYHDEMNGRKRGRITMFKVEKEGIRLLHVGDLGHILASEQLSEIGEVDILFIPVGGVYTVDAKGAYENAIRIRPKVIVPMHYKITGMSLGIAPVDEFLKLFRKDQVEYVGNSIYVTRDDLPKEMQVWVFTL